MFNNPCGWGEDKTILPRHLAPACRKGDSERDGEPRDCPATAGNEKPKQTSKLEALKDLRWFERKSTDPHDAR